MSVSENTKKKIVAFRVMRSKEEKKEYQQTCPNAGFAPKTGAPPNAELEDAGDMEPNGEADCCCGEADLAAAPNDENAPPEDGLVG